ncbi:hypothetical protein N7540_013080 [Penicillium herquei]|nr:hypothetical protein N7540_013080 [Penicillium herquei]
MAGLHLLREQQSIKTHAYCRFFYAACRAGSLATVQSLLSQKVIQINQKAPTGTSPLHVAVINQHPEIVSFLISQKEIALNDVGPSGFTALMFAAANWYTTCVESLLGQSNIDLKVKNNYGYCAFRLTILHRHVREMNMLRSAGSDKRLSILSVIEL